MTTETLKTADNEQEEKTPGRNTRSIQGAHIFFIIIVSLVFAYGIKTVGGSINLMAALVIGVVGSWIAIVVSFTLQHLLVWASRDHSCVQTPTGEVKVNAVWASVKSMRGDRGKRYGEKWHAYSRYIRKWALTLYLVIALGWGMFFGLWWPVLMNIGNAGLKLCTGNC